MFESVLYIILAILGLGFLVFIHELGHYIMARKVGMRVEAFAIGFGKPLITWERDGVKWHICMLPFGGYVKIAGMQKEGNLEPHQIKDGFFGAKPKNRIAVAIMGPLVNIIFAFLAFTALWMLGGREKSFSEFTKRIGWLDQNSSLFNHGVRPGDEIQDLDGKPFSSFKDLLLAAVTDDDTSSVKGYKIDYLDAKKKPFEYTLKTYNDPRDVPEGLMTVGILAPASYLIYDEAKFPLFPGSPLENSGLQNRDRFFWIDGEIVFSLGQLKSLLSESTVFLTVERDGHIIHSKIPRVQIDDFSLTYMQKANLDDWRHEAGLSGKKLEELHFIPYVLSYDNTVQGKLNFIDENDQRKAFMQCTRCSYFNPLQNGDKILAVDGIKLNTSDDLLSTVQEPHSLIIVQRNPLIGKEIDWTDADRDFDRYFNPQNLNQMIASIGVEDMKHAGDFHLLNTIHPKKVLDFEPSEDKRAYLAQIDQAKKKASKMASGEKKQHIMAGLDALVTEPSLGAYLMDKQVRFNPNPFYLFGSVFAETFNTLSSLVTGSIHPKWLSGPVGIINVVQQSWSLGFKEALFWMGVISLNLGMLNLLPIPVLDGGHITLSVVEMARGKPIKAKTMEKLIIPFVVLLIGLILFVTYHDISRIFSSFF